MKFECSHAAVKEDGSGEANFHAVTHGSDENEKFFAATPSGDLSLQILNKSAMNLIEEGKEYYLVLQEVETED